MDPAQQARLNDALPTLTTLPDPTTLRHRLEFLTSHALRKYAPEALRAAGANSAAAILEDEPSMSRQAARAKQMADSLCGTVPTPQHSPRDARTIAAARASRHAAKAANHLAAQDPGTRRHAGQHAGHALTEWAKATGSDPVAEARALLTALTNIE